MEISTVELKEKKDSLKELEELLESDILSANQDEGRLIPKSELTRIIIRLSIFIFLALILVFTRILGNFFVFLVATVIFIFIEGINVLKVIKAGKKKPFFEEKD